MGLGKGVKSWRVLNRPTTAALLLIASFVSEGCQSYLIDRTDRGVYRLIEDKQKGALGATSNANIGPESGETGARMDSRTSISISAAARSGVSGIARERCCEVRPRSCAAGRGGFAVFSKLPRLLLHGQSDSNTPTAAEPPVSGFADLLQVYSVAQP